ncbi:MAG: hypothetical protein KJ941_03250 [Bacteroidetes bacterium]|nr:hypothetical protein [Bacteroidota bacterium]
MKTFLYTLVVATLFSCKNEKTQEINLNDIIEGAGIEGDTAVIEEAASIYWYDSLSMDLQRLTDSLPLNKGSFQKMDTLFFVDRFKHKTSEKVLFDSLGAMAFYTYADSLDSKNAFFNWLDCFGKRCNSILLFEEKKISNNAFVMVVTERHIFYLEATEWTLNKEICLTLEKTFGKEKILYLLEQPKGRKTRWWQNTPEQWKLVKKER